MHQVNGLCMYLRIVTLYFLRDLHGEAKLLDSASVRLLTSDTWSAPLLIFLCQQQDTGIVMGGCGRITALIRVNFS